LKTLWALYAKTKTNEKLTKNSPKQKVLSDYEILFIKFHNMQPQLRARPNIKYRV